MANFRKTILFVNADSAKRISEIKDYLRSDCSELDFNKIRLMPEDLNIEDSFLGRININRLDNTVKKRVLAHMTLEKRQKGVLLKKKYQENVRKHGYATWYEWRINNWGTKWNAFNVSVKQNTTTELEYHFETANGLPIDLIIELSRIFPDANFTFGSFGEFPEEPFYKGWVMNGELLYDSTIIEGETQSESIFSISKKELVVLSSNEDVFMWTAFINTGGFPVRYKEYSNR
jgi:hypothetical protein